MRAARILIILAVGVAYIWYTNGHPEDAWVARGIAIVVLISVGMAFRKAGAPAGDPMTPEPIQSLNLAGRDLDKDAR